jgi:hypothetical protein
MISIALMNEQQGLLQLIILLLVCCMSSSESKHLSIAICFILVLSFLHKSKTCEERSNCSTFEVHFNFFLIASIPVAVIYHFRGKPSRCHFCCSDDSSLVSYMTVQKYPFNRLLSSRRLFSQSSGPIFQSHPHSNLNLEAPPFDLSPLDLEPSPTPAHRSYSDHLSSLQKILSSNATRNGLIASPTCQ